MVMAGTGGLEGPIDQASSSNDAIGGRASAQPAFPPALIEAALSRIVESETFRRSQRHRDFLGHIVRAAIDGRPELLKEVVIGIEVFRRPLDRYDPRRDPIVRVEAARIREKLARFYAGEGAGEPFEIVVPVGAYLPKLQRRNAARVESHALVSLAVLPFENLSGGALDDAFRLGITDLLIDTLSRVRGLKVVARASAVKAREGSADPRATGHMLGVAHLIEGSLQRSGTRLRCFAHITRIADATRIWSRRFDVDDTQNRSTFSLQDEIAKAVEAAVQAAAEGADSIADDLDATAKGPPHQLLTSSDDQARLYFDRARSLMQQRTFEGYERAIRLLERTVAIDPRFARGHACLAMACGHFIGFTNGPIDALIERTRASAERALSLDPLDGEATSILAAMACRFDHDWPLAERLYRRGIDLSPSSPFAHSTYAWGLCFQGRFAAAIAHIGIAFELDPLNLGTRVNRAFIHTYARRYETAVDEFNAILELEPLHLMSHVQLGLTYLWTQESARAKEHFDIAYSIWPAHPLVLLCRIAAVAQGGDRHEAQSQLDRFLSTVGDAPFSRFTLAMAYACLDDVTRCAAALEAAALHKDFNFASVPIVPLFDRFRDHPDFHALRTRYRLASVDVYASA